MRELKLVKRVMDHVVNEDLEPVLDLIASDVALTIVRPGSGAGSFERLSGRQSVGDYFAVLGGIVRFWHLRLVGQKTQVLVLVRERYTTTGGMESATDLAIVLEVRNGSIAEILVAEDLSILLGSGVGSLVAERRTVAGLRPTVYLADAHPDSERASA